jgi:cobalt/nickel transport system permease protein
MYLDQLAFRKDILKSFDGRCRLLSAALVIIAIVSAKNTVLLCVVSLAFLCAMIREPGSVIRRLLPVNMMSIALWLPVIAGLSPWSALLYTLRINCAALAYMCLVAPMSISLIASSLSALALPEKLVSLFVLTYRSLFLLCDGLDTALVSMRSRLSSSATGRQWRSLAAVFAATLARSALRSEKALIAMANRGFAGAFPITFAFKWRIRDSVLLAASAVSVPAVVWLI